MRDTIQMGTLKCLLLEGNELSWKCNFRVRLCHNSHCEELNRIFEAMHYMQNFSNKFYNVREIGENSQIWTSQA